MQSDNQPLAYTPVRDTLREARCMEHRLWRGGDNQVENGGAGFGRTLLFHTTKKLHKILML